MIFFSISPFLKTPLRVNFLEQLNRGQQNSPIRPLPRSRPSPGRATPTTSFQGSLHERSFGNVTQPLLGYDWIAGLLDNDATTEETSNTYLEEIRQFRQLNRDECVHTSVLEEWVKKFISSVPIGFCEVGQYASFVMPKILTNA